MSNTTQLKIEGMTCGHCVRTVSKALEGVPGVQSAAVDLTAGTASVVHDGTALPETLTKAVEEEGYAASAAGATPTTEGGSGTCACCAG
ncbi:MAG: CopZ family metallochaperone [Fimbriimonas sp.]